MLNPTLSDLIGGIQTVTLGDDEARRRRTQKSVLERKAPPTFDVVVEIADRDRVAVHADVAETVDALLRGDALAPEMRWRDEGGVHRTQARRGPGPRSAPARRALRRSRRRRPRRLGPRARLATGPPARAASRRLAEPGGPGAVPRGRGRSRSRAAPEAAPARSRASAGRASSAPAAWPTAGRSSEAPRARAARPRRAASTSARQTGVPRRTVPSTRSADAEAGSTSDAVGRAGESVGRSAPSCAGRAVTRPVSGDCRDASTRRTRRPSSSASRTSGWTALPLEPLNVLGYGISRKRLEQAIRDLELPVVVVREPDEADVVITLRNAYKQKSPVLREAEARGLPIYVLKSNTVAQMQAILTSLYALETDPQRLAMRELEEAIGLVRAESKPVELSPAERLRAPAPAPRRGGRQPRLAVARARALPSGARLSREGAGLALSRPSRSRRASRTSHGAAASSCSRDPTVPASRRRRRCWPSASESLGHAVTLTREPGGTRLGEQVRAILLDPSDVVRGPVADALLFNAARAQLVAEVIRPALERGDIVVCDRYATSTLAYQGYGSGVDRDGLRDRAGVGHRRAPAGPRRASSTCRSRSGWRAGTRVAPRR